MYRRYNTSQPNVPQKPTSTVPKPSNKIHETSNKVSHNTPVPPPLLQNNQYVRETPDSSHNCPNPPCRPKQNTKSQSPYGALLGLIPHHIYNPETKKILGFLSSEDLLLIALIFLFLESDDDNNPLMVLALVYVLLGEYIDLGDFTF